MAQSVLGNNSSLLANFGFNVIRVHLSKLWHKVMDFLTSGKYYPIWCKKVDMVVDFQQFLLFECTLHDLISSSMTKLCFYCRPIRVSWRPHTCPVTIQQLCSLCCYCTEYFLQTVLKGTDVQNVHRVVANYAWLESYHRLTSIY